MLNPVLCIQVSPLIQINKYEIYIFKEIIIHHG